MTADGLRLGHEVVAVPPHGPDHPLGSAVVADRLSDLLDPGGERGLGDEPVAPYLVEQLVLRHHPLGVPHQVGQQIEGLALEGSDGTVDGHLPTIEGDDDIVERDRTDGRPVRVDGAAHAMLRRTRITTVDTAAPSSHIPMVTEAAMVRAVPGPVVAGGRASEQAHDPDGRAPGGLRGPRPTPRRR